MSFENQVALITGGSSGIGLATARLLAAQGAHVWLMARRQEQLDAALAEVQACRHSPNQCCGTVAADVADPQQVLSAVDRVIRAAGVPHLVINSAGVTHPGYFQDIDLESFRWQMEINFFGTVHVIKAILPGMLQRGSGHIVNVSSLVGHIGIFGYTAYGASKFALSGFTDTLRAELKPLGIHVSLVIPPDTDTPQLAYENQFKPPETKILWFGNNPMVSAESVATEIVEGVIRKRYLIIPGLDTKVLFRLSQLVGGWLYPIMDWLVARARKEVHRKNGNG